MKKQIVVLCAALALVACQPQQREVSNSFAMPRELSHCKIHELTNGLTVLYVVTCEGKNAVATSKPGKHPVYVSVLE
jgi:hypothetical protein